MSSSTVIPTSVKKSPNIEVIKNSPSGGNTGSTGSSPRTVEFQRQTSSGIASSPSIANASMNAVTTYLKHLLGLNAKPTKRSLSEEAECGSPESLNEWLRQGSNPNETDPYGYTPLVNACLRGCTKSATILITNGADVNMKAIHGYSPLHAAAQNGFFELVELLVDSGADMEVKNDDGDTPLMLAVRSDHPEVVDALCKRGCNMHTSGFDNIEPIDYALNKRNLYLSDVLLKHERQNSQTASESTSPPKSSPQTSQNQPIKSNSQALSPIKENLSLSSLIQKEQELHEARKNSSNSDLEQKQDQNEANASSNNDNIFQSE